ncbi:MAG: hypothetical protein JXB04_12500, partial [Kiritimatiellae bacterium]|nr:hypothetical protein [Kiritimatiellia bacterium]
LQRVPGLIREGASARPYWLDKLHALSLPDWDNVFWRAYVTGWPKSVLRTEARLSRGHSRLPADRAFGNTHEPLRLWPLDRVARTIQKCAALGVNEVFLSDPPGIWTPERLSAWCAVLEESRNAQPWGFQLLPTSLSEQTVSYLAFVQCRRVEFLFPSCSPEVLSRYGCVIGASDLSDTLDLLRSFKIEARVRFWMGGPEESKGEQERIAGMIRALRYVPATLQAFPFSMDSPLYEERAASVDIPHLEDWIRWSRDPWTVERPVPLWGGQPGVSELQAAFAAVHKAVIRSPQRVLLRMLTALRSTNWIRVMEDKAVGLITQMTPPKP